MNDSIHFIKTQPLFWPVLLSLLAHGVFVLCWQPHSAVVLTPPQPVQVEFRTAGTPQGDDRPAGSAQAAAFQSKSEPAPARQSTAVERKTVSPQSESKTVTAKPVLTRPENSATADNQPAPAAAGNMAAGGMAVPGGAAAQGKGETAGAGRATGSGAGKGEGDGQGRGPKGDAPPGRLYAPKPKYPETSIEMGEVGSVRLSLTITRDGNVRNVRVAGSSGFPRLDKQARYTVENWRFKPAIKNGEAAETPYGVTVRFNLNGTVSTSGG